jgi:tRNA pseudouridine55 synthase
MDGVVIINKEKGFTSQDALRVVKGILEVSKVGHTGTLDPDATGVLPVCIGKATRIAEIIAGKDKEYVAKLVFGSETDTQDASGVVTRSCFYRFDPDKAREAALSFIGSYSQIPPMYSAVKVNGRKLYKLARQGMTVDRQPRTVTIYDLDIRDMDEGGMTIRVVCSKGTYIRTLCEDIGRKTGYLAHMTSLVRTRTGPYRLEEAMTLKELEALVKAGKKDQVITDLNTLFEDLPVWKVVPEEEIFLLNGNYLTYPAEKVPGEVGDLWRMQTSDGHLAGLYKISQVLENGTMKRLRAYKMFV